MRIKVKETCCPWCGGELVVDKGITCIDDCDCHDTELRYHPETMARLQPVIDYHATVQGGQK